MALEDSTADLEWNQVKQKNEEDNWTEFKSIKFANRSKRVSNEHYDEVEGASWENDEEQ